MIEAELPDGTVLEFPDGTSPDVMRQAVQRMKAPAKQPSFMQMLKDEVVGSLPVQTAMGALRGAGSIGATAIRPFESGAENAQRRESMTGALQSLGADPSSVGFNVGKIGAEIAGTAGIPGVIGKGAQAVGAAPAIVNALRTGGMSTGLAPATMAGKAGNLALRAGAAGATGGAAAGLVNPEDMGTGAAISAGIPLVGAAAGAAGGAIGRALRPSAETQAMAQKAQQYGIPLGLGDVAENRTIQATRSILRDAPFSGGMAQSAREGQQEAFNRAVGAQFGAPEKKLTLDVLDQAKKRMGSEFDRIWNNNALQVDPQMMSKLTDLDALAQKLPRNEGASLQAEIQDLMAKMVPDANGNAVVPGDVANKFQQYLRRRAEGSAGLRNELGDLRQAVIGAFNRSVSPADAAALTANRTQYKAFKTVEPILRSAELGVAGRTAGDVPAALLPGAVNKSYSTLDVPLADLSQVGSRFLVDRTPQTGGSMRAALQNTAIGAALMGTGGIPGLVGGAVAGTGAQKTMQSQRLANALLSGQGGQVSPELLQFLRASAPVLSAQ